MKPIALFICIVLSFLDTNAQTCLNCTSTTTINNGLVFCTTMTGNALDGTASPVTPTITGNVTLTTDRFNSASSAYEFLNSNTTKITYSNASKLNVPLSQSFSMSLWFYQYDSTTTPGYLNLLMGSDTSSYGFYIAAYNSSASRKIVFQDYYGPTKSVRTSVTSSNKVQIKTWNHVMITIDKSTGIYTLYYNGASVGTTIFANPSIISSANFFLGNGAVNPWGINGKVDDVRIYNRALSSTEASQLYSSTIPALTTIANPRICKGDSIILNPGNTSPNIYSWSPASTLNNFAAASPIAKPLATTKYYVSMQNGGCSAQDSVTIQVDTINLDASDKNVCLGASANLVATGASSYLWTPATGLSNAQIANPIVTPAKTIFYVVKGTSGSCVAYDTVTVSVCDCNQITKYDTLTVTRIDTIVYRDTIHTTKFDTIHIALHDTLHITITDTVRLTLRDTIRTTLTDTIYKTINDTVHVVIRDTIPVGVTDTLYINIVKTGLNLPNNILNTLKVYPNPATDEIVINTGNYLQTPNYTVRIMNITGQTVYTGTINRQELRITTSALGSAGTYTLQLLDHNNNLVETRKVVLR